MHYPILSESAGVLVVRKMCVTGDEGLKACNIEACAAGLFRILPEKVNEPMSTFGCMERTGSLQ
jgi:hypothetical protein